MRNITTTQITLFAVLVLGLVLAMFVGAAIGTSDIKFIAAVLGLVPLVILLVSLKQMIWVLIPIGWFLNFRMGILPLPFSLRDLSILVPTGFFISFIALRIVPWRRERSLLDYLILINLAYLLSVFLRHPVGFSALGSSMVGGRPYLDIALATCAFLILSRAKPGPGLVRFFPLLSLVPLSLFAALDLLARFVPSTLPLVAMLNSSVASAGAVDATGMSQEMRLGETRAIALAEPGRLGIYALCSYYSPITLLLPIHPLRMAMFGLAMGAIFLSGFRGLLFQAVVMFFLGTLFRRNLRHLWIIGAGGLMFMIALVSTHGSFYTLPMTAQRALSWLPGDWDPQAKQDAEGSSEWRFEMWQWAWEDTRILRDKVWGQGFGLSADDMAIYASAAMAGGSVGAEQAFVGGSKQEWFLITGGFHSGPISAIRVVGAVGLSLFLVLLVYMAITAYRLCRAAYGRPYFGLALFVALPVIYEPFNYIFIFGGFDAALPTALFYSGLLNMVRNVASSYEEELRKKAQPSAAELSEHSGLRPFPAGGQPRRFAGELQPVR